MEMMENYLLFSVSVLLFFFWKDNLCVKNPLYFPLFLKLFESFSLFTSKHRKKRQKTFIFCFSPVLFFLKKKFSFYIFPFSSLSSLLSLLTFSFSFFVHLYLLFSPFSFLSILLPFFLSQCFSLSFFLYLMFPHLFFPSPFLCIFFWINSFFFSLLFLISIFLFFLIFSSFPYPFFHVKPNTKFSLFLFRRRLFFEPSLFSVFNLVFFLIASSLFLVCSMFFEKNFERFLKLLFLIFFLSIFFSGLQKIVVVFGHNFQKISLILVRKITLGKNLCFRDFDNFCFWFFSCMIFNFPFFCLFRANIVFLLS